MKHAIERTAQTDKLDSMAASAHPSGVTVTLTAKPGEQIDVADM